MHKEPLTLEQRVERLETTIGSAARKGAYCSVAVKDLVEIAAAMERADTILHDKGLTYTGLARLGLANAKKLIRSALDA